MRARKLTLTVLLVAGLVVVFAYVYKKHHAINRTPHSVTLKWSPSAGATSYNVYRSETRGAVGSKIGASTAPTYVDTAVPGGATLYYTVTAVAHGHESGHSNEATAVIP